jgi:hypothetical protein
MPTLIWTFSDQHIQFCPTGLFFLFWDKPVLSSELVSQCHSGQSDVGYRRAWFCFGAYSTATKEKKHPRSISCGFCPWQLMPCAAASLLPHRPNNMHIRKSYPQFHTVASQRSIYIFLHSTCRPFSCVLSFLQRPTCRRVRLAYLARCPFRATGPLNERWGCLLPSSN